MPKLPKAAQEYASQLADLFRDSGWNVRAQPNIPGDADLIINNDDLEYVVEVKRAAESRRDRVIPLLAEAILQVQAYGKGVPGARGLAIIASPLLSPAVVDQAIEFQQNYAPDVAVGFFDDRGYRFFRAPRLESLNSPPPKIEQRRIALAESQSFSLFSDLGQWMLKVILAQGIESRFLNAPRQRIRNASELAKAANVSQVSASRLVRQLEVEGFLDKYAGQLQLVRIQDLLEDWQAAERRAFKDIPCRWIIPGHGGKRFEAELRDYLSGQPHRDLIGNYGERRLPRVCLGLFVAAEALGLGFVHGVPPILYVERVEARLLEKLGISQEKASHADICLRIPAHKESVFRPAVERHGILVSDALQVWLDVSNHPSRGREQADRIRDQVLGPLLSK